MFPSTMLFVWLFVVVMGWMFVASAVAVGVEHGLRRYYGQSKSGFQSAVAERQPEADEKG